MALFPEGAAFNEVDKGNAADEVSKIVEVKDNAGARLGYCVSVAPGGYKGAININVGVKADGTLSGIRIGSNSETAGLGARIAEPDFYEQYAGQAPPINFRRADTGHYRGYHFFPCGNKRREPCI